MTALYLDTSAAAKLILDEPGSAATRRFIQDFIASHGGGPSLVSSDLLRTELLATVGRVGASLDEARLVLRGVVLVQVTSAICDSAGRLAGEPGNIGLRSLDAIHLATVLSVVSDVEAVVTFDRRFASATKSVGIPVVTPQ